jgi:hypothetical protein
LFIVSSRKFLIITYLNSPGGGWFLGWRRHHQAPGQIQRKSLQAIEKPEEMHRRGLAFGRCPAIVRANALVAQLDRASDFESEGREFESLRARHAQSLQTKVLLQLGFILSVNRSLISESRYL